MCQESWWVHPLSKAVGGIFHKSSWGTHPVSSAVGQGQFYKSTALGTSSLFPSSATLGVGRIRPCYKMPRDTAAGFSPSAP